MSLQPPTTTRIGASLDIRIDQPVEEFVRLVTDRGLEHVELRWEHLDVTGTPDPAHLRELADTYDVSFTVHGPHVDLTLGNLNERLREAAVAEVGDALEYAAAIDAEGVIVHGGAANKRYPAHARETARENAVRSLRTCTDHAAAVGVPLCLENQFDTGHDRRFTTTPERFEQFLADIDADPAALQLTLDVGHAKVTGVDYREFVDRFDDRIRVVHLHDNDGTDDDHDPLPTFRSVVSTIEAPINVLEMKSPADIDRCLQN